MAIVKRFNKLLGLDKIDVLVDERDTSRHIIITDMPQSLPQGKSSFLIEVSPYMRQGIELQIDFIDSRGNSIYVEPVSDYLEGTSRTVSVEVYSTVAPGPATMIIVGELDELPTEPGNFSKVEEIPTEFRGVYNVRLTREVIINTAEINTQPIKFYSSPRLTAVEKRFGTMIREVVDGPTTSSLFSVTGDSTPNGIEPYDFFVAGENENASQGAGVEETNDTAPQDPPKGDIKGDEAEKEKLKQSSKKRSVRKSSRSKRSKRIRRRRSPVDYQYVFTIEDDNHEFTTEQIGGKITFSNIDTSIYSEDDLRDADLEEAIVSFNVVTDPNDPNFPTHYTASIADLGNNKTAYVNTPFTKQDKTGQYRLLKMKATGEVEYTREPSASYSLSNIVSYADITLSHLRSFSGEVFKAKVYVRSEGSFDDFKLLAEVPIESPELMVNENSVGIGERTGYFISEEDKNTYWDLFGGTNGLGAATSTSTASFDNSTMLDSVMISGSTSVFTDHIRFQSKDAYKFNLTKNIDYTLSANIIGQKDVDGRALLLVYVSGSSVQQKTTLYSDEKTGKDIDEPSQYGKRMGSLDILSGEDSIKDFGFVTHNFNPHTTGDALVQFRVIAGKWNISDVSVVPSTDTGFSPSFVRFQQELPPELTHKRPETLEFLTEFYDINNNIADEVAVTTGSVFTGANMVITGDDNNMSGDLFIGGDTTASGMHFGGVDSNLPETGTEGATSSGFMRSVGYLGFKSASNASLGGKPGFMIYSGSVLPASGDDYKGVGLELVGASGSLKFRTNPSLFDVQADAFFVGKTTTQFISGSGEKIEISSSNFHLDDAGNVDMTGTVTANAGSIGGWTIKDNSLRAGIGNAAVTMSGANQQIRMGSGSIFQADSIDGVLFGKDTDGKYKFGIGKGNSYIFFDGDVVNIRSEDINVTASVFTIDVDVFKLSANNLFISSSDGGFISAGNPRPSGITGTNKGVFIGGNDPSDNKPKFLAGDAAGARLSFDGDNIFMSSSGFFLGGPSQFVSGSNGNLEISSSNFHLSNAGDVTMTGTVTAAAGKIGGLTIGSTKLNVGTAYEISSSTNVSDPVSFISSSAFKVSAGGQVTASGLSLSGGDVGGLSVAEGTISVGEILKLKDSGQITGSSVLFSGGTIGGFTLSSGGLIDSADSIQLSSTHASMSLGTGQEVLIRGNSNSPFISIQPSVALVDKAYAETGVFFGVAGGSTPLFSAVGSGGHIKFNGTGIDISAATVHMSGSSIRLETPKFFLGKHGSQFVSGSNNLIEISSSGIHLTPEGNVTASSILLGKKSAGQFLQFSGGTLTVQGSITADSIAVPSAAPTPSSSITSDGLLTTVSASIGGFDIVSSEIKDKDNNLRLKSSGQITGSQALFTGGKIGGWAIGSSTLTGGSVTLNSGGSIKVGSLGNATTTGNTNSGFFADTDGNILIKGNTINSNYFKVTGDGAMDIRVDELVASGSSITIETPKFFLGKHGSQFVSGSNGNIEITSSMFHLDPTNNKVSISGSITATDGTIGGFTIDHQKLRKDLSGGGFLEAAAISDTNARFLITDNGDLSGGTGTYVQMFKYLSDWGLVGYSGGSRIFQLGAVNVIAGWTIDADEIKSTNNTVILDSDTNSGKIALGSTPPTAYNNGNGIYFDGEQKALIGSSTGSRIQFDGVNDLVMSSSKFFLGSNEQFVSASLGSLEISSSTFHVSGGNTIMSGKITANEGTIGGWNITSNRLADSSDEIRLDSSNQSISIKNHTFSQAGFQVEYNGGSSRLYVGDGSNKFIKFDGSDVDIKSEKFELDATDLEISSAQKSMSLGEGKIRLVGGSTSTITIGASNSITLSDDGSDRFMAIGKSNFTQFDQSTAGLILGTDNGTTKFELAANASNYISFNGSDFDIKTETFKLDTTKLDIDSSTARIEVLTSGSVSYQSDWSSGVDGWVTGLAHAGNQDSVTDGSTTKNDVYRMMIQDGNLVAPHSYRNVSVTSGESYTISLTYLIPDAGSTGGANSGVNGFRFAVGDSSDVGAGTYDDGVVGTWTTVEHTLTAGSSTIQIRIYPTDDVSYTYSSGGIHVGDRIYISNMTVTPNRVRVRIGEVDSTSADHYGLVIFDGTGTEESDEIVHLSDARNTIASWSLSPTQITSRNLVIDSAGIIQTSDFASGVQGWRITSANNGEAEFEKVTVRGTLATTVFEKESVNAVGGQLYVANSTIITSSAQVSAGETTMSVANVSGFTQNEILSAKKVTDTGFQTEYLFVNSASRNQPSSDKDLSGKLYVTRGYGSSVTGDSGSLGDTPSSATTYENGQVIVSTGKINTGYIRLNANPNDTTTPYMDIVERTGSGIYDISLKARLGDLSGLSSGLLYGNSSPGFGLFTENVFLQGAITATTGSIEGILHVRTDLSNQIKIGTNVNGSLDGIYVNNDNFWYTNGHFKTGFDADNFIHQSGSSLTINSETFTLKGGTTLVLDSSTPKLVMGTDASSITNTDNTGVYIDGTGKFRVGEDQGSGDNFIYFNGTTIQMKSTVFDLTAGGELLINSSTPKIALGSSVTAQSLTAGTGVFMNGSGHFKVGKAGAGRISFDGSQLIVSSSEFLLGNTSTNFISASNGNMQISSSKFHIKEDGDIIVKKVTAVEGSIAAWNISGNNIASVGAGGIRLNGNGDNAEISINSHTFGNEGIQMGYNTGSPRFYAGDGSNNFLRYDTSNGVNIKTLKATISGSEISLLTPKFYFGNSSNYISGSNGNISIFNTGTTTLSGSQVTIEAPRFYMGESSQYISGSNGNIEISSSKFHLQRDGDTIMQGKITATSGKIANWEIESDYISKALSGHSETATSRVYLSAANDDTQNIQQGLHLYRDDDDTTNGEVKVVRVGGLSDTTNLHATASNDFGIQVIRKNSNNNYSNIVYIGKSEQKIAGWNIDTDALYTGTKTTTGYSSNGSITLTSNGEIHTPTFYVEADGSSAFKGTLTIDSTLASQISGSQNSLSESAATGIAGLTEGSQSMQTQVKLSSDGMTLNQADGTTLASYGDAITLGLTSGTENNVYIDNDSVDIRRGTQISASFGTTTTIGPTSGKHVKITGTALEIKTDANTTALSASAAGLEMSGKVRATSGDIGGFDITSVGIISSDGNLVLSGSGQITASAAQITGKVTATAGAIADWNVDTNTLQGASRIELNSSGTGTIRLGGSFGPSQASSTTQGVFLGGNGEFGIIESETNRIYSEGTGLNIYSVGSGVVDISGSSVSLKAPTFYLGESSQYISGSNGNIEISSSNFHLTNTGDVTMQGTVTANAGEVSGFTITGSTLFSNASVSDSDGGFVTGSVVLSPSYPNNDNLPLINVTNFSQSMGVGIQQTIKASTGAARVDFWMGRASLQNNGGVEAGVVSQPNSSYEGFMITTSTGSNGINTVLRNHSGVSYGGTLDGFYLESGFNGSRFQIGKANASHIRYSGNDDFLFMKSERFFLGGSSFISGSNGNIRIASTNFNVAENGTVSMSGNIVAPGGQISTFAITSGSIDSDPQNSKRGIKLEPGKSIRGYGKKVHQTISVPGKFAFGVASIAPPAKARKKWKYGELTTGGTGKKTTTSGGGFTIYAQTP